MGALDSFDELAEDLGRVPQVGFKPGQLPVIEGRDIDLRQQGNDTHDVSNGILESIEIYFRRGSP